MRCRNCSESVVLCLVVLVSSLNARNNGMPQNRPDDLGVAAYELTRKQIAAVVEKEAKNRKAFLDDAKTIDALAIPWKLRQEVTVRVRTGRGRYVPRVGKLYKIEGRNIILGDRSISMANIYPDDKARLSYISRPDLLRKFIADRKKDLQTRIATWIRNEVDARLEAEGYTRKFFDRTVVMADKYWFRNSLGDHGRLRATITVFDAKCQHMNQFVDIKMEYFSKEEISAVLYIDGSPVAAVGARGANGAIQDLAWQSVTFRLPRKALFGAGGDVRKILGKGVVVRCMKQHVGQWELQGRVTGPRHERIKRIPCPECCGKKESAPPPAVDISTDVAPYLKGPQTIPGLQHDLEELVKKYGMRQDKGQTVPCTYCNAAGTIVPAKGPGTAWHYSLSFSLGDNKPASLDQAAAAQQAKAFATFDRLVKEVEAMEATEAGKIAADYLQIRRKQALLELGKLVTNREDAIARNMYAELEKINWKEPDKVPNAGVGTSSIDPKNSGFRGHRPKKLFNLPVRRMTPWQTVSSFRSFGSLFRNEFAVTSALFRFVEIGGTPIVKGNAKVDESTQASTHGNGGREDETGLRRDPAEDKEATEDATVVIPKDLLKRRYVLQYATQVGTRRGFQKFTFDVSLCLKLTANRLFDLKAGENKVILKNQHILGPNWAGHLVGAQLITRNQVLAHLNEEKNISFSVNVTKK